MKLKQIKIENIRSYKHQEISFPDGSTLLSGDIGSGKTSILLAIEFALFGLQPGQRGTSLLRNGEDEGKVCLEFESDGNIIRVERSLKRGSKTVNQSYSSFEINGEKEELSSTELKNRILSILKYPHEFIKKTNLLYRFTVYSPQEGMKQIITEDPELRLNILRHVFGVDKYRRIKENIQIVTSKLKEELRSIQSRTLDLESLQKDIEANQERRKQIDIFLEEKKSILENKIALRKKIESELEDLEKKVDEKRKFESELEKANLMSSNKKIQLSDISSELKELEARDSEDSESFNKEELEKVLSQIEDKRAKISELNETYIALQASVNSIRIKKQEELEKRNRVFKIDFCPTCLQNVSEHHKHNILNDTETSLVKADKDISLGEREIGIMKEMIEKENSILDQLYSQKSRMKILEAKEGEKTSRKQRIAQLKKNLELVTKDVEFLTSHLKSIKDSIFQFSVFDSKYRAKEMELSNARKEEKAEEISFAELRKEKELLESHYSVLLDKISEKQNVLQRLSKLAELEEWLSKDFTELISYTERNIMFKLRQEFSKLFNKWFEMLTTDNFYAQLDENFTPIIMQGEFEIDYAFLSGGERTAVALAYRLALNQTINSIFSKIKTKNLVILDEPTDGFSDQQLDKVREVLHELNLEQLIIVSHEQKVESFVDNILRLKKEQQISKIG